MNNSNDSEMLARLGRLFLQLWLVLLLASALTAGFLVKRLLTPIHSVREPIEEVPSLNARVHGIPGAALTPKIQNKRKPLVIAIIDTGMDVEHPDLQGFLWNNAGEGGQEAHGFDGVHQRGEQDRNSVDELHGWNFADSSSDLTDRHGHGTHIAGIIHREIAKYQDIKRDRPITFMILKYYDDKKSGYQNLQQSNAALNFAIKHGAAIINYSGGGRDPSPDERKLMMKAREKGILIVAAAGNEAQNADRNPFYPASYGLENIVSVANVTEAGSLARTSNFGKNSVDIAAPGERILSTTPGGREAFMTGTSQSTAFVTAALAVYLASRPDAATEALDFEDLREHLYASVELKTAMRGLLRSGGELHTASLIASRSKFETAADLLQVNTALAPEFLIAGFSSDGSFDRNQQPVVGRISIHESSR